MTEIVPALVSLIVLGILAVQVRGRLAFDYADRLSAATAVSEGQKKRSGAAVRGGMLFRGGESRAVALLIRNQFKYDQKFRLAVLSILPLTAIYFFMALREGPLADPFVTAEGFNDSLLLYFSVLMFPVIMKNTLSNSDAYQASWIYYATPADRGRLVLASKNFVFAYFVIPYLILIGALFFYFFPIPWHGLVHLGILALLSHSFLQIAVFFSPVLPFSMPVRKAQRSGSFILVLTLGPIAAILLLFVFARWVYPNPALLLGVLAAFAAGTHQMERALKARVQSRTVSLEYHE